MRLCEFQSHLIEIMADIGEKSVELILFPSLDGARRVIKVLKKATRHMDICLFEFTYMPFAECLFELAKEKNVKIRLILHDKKCDDQEVGYLNSKAKVQGLLRSSKNIEIKFHQGWNISRLMHNKFCLIDNDILMTGSLNWTKNGTSNNHENNIVLEDQAELVREIRERFELLWEDPNRDLVFQPTALNLIEGRTRKEKTTSQSPCWDQMQLKSQKLDRKTDLKIEPHNNFRAQSSDSSIKSDESEASRLAHQLIPHINDLGKRNSEELTGEPPFHQIQQKILFKTPEIRQPKGDNRCLDSSDTDPITPPEEISLITKKKRLIKRRRKSTDSNQLLSKIDFLIEKVTQKTIIFESKSTDTRDLDVHNDHEQRIKQRGIFSYISSLFCGRKNTI